MSETSDIKKVTKSRKSYCCLWCGERIEAGSSYETYFCYDSRSQVRMHPECMDAMKRADLVDECLPMVGMYNRGCSCGERGES